MSLEVGVATHVGRVREANQDTYVVRPPVLAVADGMGGHACGEVAAALAVRTLEEWTDSGVHTATEGAESLRTAFAEANARILQTGTERPECRGMGTTLVALALLDDTTWALANVGDSRAYRVDDASVARLSVDHSEVEELVTAGVLTPEQARVHPARNVVTRSLGNLRSATPDVWTFAAQDGDCFVLCSDGLTNEIDDEHLGRLVRGTGAQEAADALVAAALEAGGNDNVTVVVVRRTSG